MAPPTSFTEIRHYLGATGFYRRFIKGYAKIARPLQDLISEDGSKLKKEEVTLSPAALDAFSTTQTEVYDCSCVGIHQL